MSLKFFLNGEGKNSAVTIKVLLAAVVFSSNVKLKVVAVKVMELLK